MLRLSVTPSVANSLWQINTVEFGPSILHYQHRMCNCSCNWMCTILQTVTMVYNIYFTVLMGTKIQEIAFFKLFLFKLLLNLFVKFVACMHTFVSRIFYIKTIASILILILCQKCKRFFSSLFMSNYKQ